MVVLAPLVALTGLLLAHTAAADNLVVTCGSSIKLEHAGSNFRLHSHEVAYSRGSQQQSVTAFPSGDDGNSLWIVHGPKDALCTPGDTFKKGTKLRLQHAATRRWLHSHRFYSPLSQNQEVSAYGHDNESDGGDVWAVEWDGKDKRWRQETKVRFKHVDTGMYLYSHDVKFGQPIAGQQEVVGHSRKDRNAEWQAAEGVYMPRAGADTKDAKDEL